MLCEACDIEEPNISEMIQYNSIVCGGANDKGVFQMWCEAIWHCLQSRKFQSVLHHLGGDPSNEVHFVKQCPNESEWVECNGDCSYKKQFCVKCQIPTKSFQVDAMVILHVHNQMVPVLQYEVSGEKPKVNKDVKKFSILSCWNLCYTESTYAVEIGTDFATFICYQKNCTTAAIDCNSYLVQFHGKRADGGKFSASIIKFVEMLVVALDHAYHKEGDIYKQVRHLIAIGK